MREAWTEAALVLEPATQSAMAHHPVTTPAAIMTVLWQARWTPSTNVSAGRDGPDSGVDAKAEDSGSADLRTAKDDAIAAKGTGSVDAKKSPPQLSFTVPPLERLQDDPSGDDGVRDAAAARSPGMFAGRDAEQRKKLAESEGGSVPVNQPWNAV